MAEMTDYPPPDIPALEAAFRQMGEGRGALPLANPALEVVAAGFRPWQGLWLGVVVTPWIVKLVLLPGGSPDWQALEENAHRIWAFPSGGQAFLGMDLPGFGPLQFCSPLPPAREFASQADAVAAGRAVIEAWLTPSPVVPLPPQAEAPRPLSERPLSRRDFLRGRLFRG